MPINISLLYYRSESIYIRSVTKSQQSLWDKKECNLPNNSFVDAPNFWDKRGSKGAQSYSTKY